MNRTLQVSAVALLVAFLALTVWKQRRLSDESVTRESSVTDRQKLRDFWDHYHQATSLRNGDDFEAALVHYQKALSLDPEHEESLYYAGSCLMELGRYQEAAQAYERLVDLNAESQRGLMQLAGILSSGLPGAPPPDLEKAEHLYRTSALLNPEESGPFIRLGLLALKEEKPGHALTFLHTASGFRSPEGIFLAGYAHYVMGQYTEAAGLFQKVLEIATKEARLAGKGFLFEGNSKDDQMPGPPFSPLQAAALKSMIFQYWAERRLGEEPGFSRIEIPREVLQATTRVSRVGGAPDREREAGGPQSQLLSDPSGDPAAGRMVRFEAGRPFAGVETIPGLEFEGEAVDVTSGDFDQDGQADFLLTRWKRPAILFRNRGDGSFEDKTAEAGLGGIGLESLASLFFDFDRDGHLDLFVTRYAPAAEVSWSLLNTGKECAAHHPQLFRGVEGGRFEEVTASAGLNRCYGTVQALAADVNGDGWTDLILANGGLDAGFLEPSVVLLNRRGRTFSEVFLPSYDEPGRPRGVAVTDADGDGILAIHLEGLGVFRLRDGPGPSRQES